MSRILTIGDIHGCRTALETLLEAVDVEEDDTLITLGDYVDRGPDSRGVIDCLLRLQTSCETVYLRGNHEVGMLAAATEADFASQWLSPVWGGGKTMASYGTADFAEIPKEHWQFLKATKLYHETDRHIFVHASLEAERVLEEQKEEVLLWERFGRPRAHHSGKVRICGHTAQMSGRPLSYGHAICIDTHVYGKGWLTCLEVESGKYWQANEDGDVREGLLELTRAKA